QVVVLSYYLFNGTLVERIKRQVDNLKTQYPTIRFSLTTYFGFEREIFEVLEQRVDDMRRGTPEALMPCDGCKFRAFAVEHGLGGHHHDDALPHTHDHDHPHDHAHEHSHEHPPGHDHEHDHVHARAGVPS
ncbi:MAG: sirohydrochlorin chelatase, partial [Burkholderiaceae bacterium]|nr:sirohydrochlorin chelatase [Burkholderiaceae bacterium]